MSDFEQDYDRGIDRFLARFWDKKNQGASERVSERVARIRQQHRRPALEHSHFEQLGPSEGVSGGVSEGVSGGEEVFRHCALTRVKQRCQVLVVGGGPAGLSAALGE